MDVTESSSTGGSRGGGGSDEPPVVKPLTRNGYRRLAKVELQIADAVMLDGPAIVERARQRDEGAPGFLAPEALVYFIRDAIGNGEERIRDGLIREVLERCNPHFRGTFRGFSREDRDDLQGEVLTMIVEDLFAPDDRSDFMQVRFWSYLKRRCIDACRVTFRHAEDTESLETGFLGEGGSEGRTKLDREVDPQLSPEALAMLAEGLEQLPQNLRHAFLLRHYVGMKIGPDSLADDDGGELTIAAQFGRTGRTIRNWLNEASRLLAEFQEKHDDGNSIEPTLDDALNTFVQENDRPTAGNLQEWVERYPQFRKDLIDFAAVWAEQLVLPEAEEIAAETEKLLVARAMSYVHNVAYSRDVETLRETTTDDPVRSLTGDAQRVGTKPAELARVCRLDRGLLSKLNNRQIQPWTIPAELIGMLAEQLNKTVAALKIFFAGPPRAAVGKAYLSRGKPTASPRQSFAEAVQQSSLSDEQKARWLSEQTAEGV